MSLNYLNVQSNLGSGIHGTSVTNFTLTRSNVTSNGDSTSDDGLRLGETGGSVVGVTGTVTITNSDISGNAHTGVHIRNTSGTISSLTVTNSSFNNVNDTTGGNAFLFGEHGWRRYPGPLGGSRHRHGADRQQRRPRRSQVNRVECPEGRARI